MGRRADATRHVGTELLRGVRDLGRGFGFWRVRPGLMALGLLPAALVAIALGAGIVVLILNLGALTEWLTPFSTHWWDWVRLGARYVLGFAIVAGAVVLSGFAFTALSLLFGEPVYTRIWRAVEEHEGGAPTGAEPGFWRSVGDAALLVAQGVLSGIVVWALGLVPVVGVLAPVLGFVIASRLVALELTARPLEGRGLTRPERARMLRSRNPRLLGFGLAVHLCYLVPLGQVLVMPAAVVAATLLAREAHDDPAR
ncbi:EI24 domain-containing protein [Protaetiibacter larvae]|uniref:EI24 domain-containing protein n=1 Tax=Protaetiibacter larvae TaxID=2592654 RepID=A0A5C1YCN4_9MICO|nr:EI24 domain-containing protein [Protaetiibacter larvae]QEO10637.1 EI24 domain-containing protein [Protaetiibacter larvae]